MATRTTYPGAQEFLPADPHDLTALADAATACHGCELHERATQTVFGRGTSSAELMLVGEQPGDSEDTQGKPFVGPAGHVLVDALKEAGVFERATYVTNAVKHFRWKEVRGSTRRIHEKPTAAQSTACRPWLGAELAAVRPKVVVALGATAAAALFGSSFRLTQHRGEVLDWPPSSGTFANDETPIAAALATLHPSAVLRADPADRDEYYRGLVSDLALAGTLL